MVIAKEIYGAARWDPLPPIGNPCSYSEVLDTVRAAEYFFSLVNTYKAIRFNPSMPSWRLQTRCIIPKPLSNVSRNPSLILCFGELVCSLTPTFVGSLHPE